MTKHVLSILVEDKPGLLTRVAGLFARRSFNIESLAVGTSEIEGLSRITVVVSVDGAPLEQVTKQINKLVNVIKVVELDPEAVQRDHMLIKVKTDAAIKLAMETNDRPVVIDFIVSRDAMVWPMVAAGVSNDEVKYARDAAPVWDGRE